MKKKYEFTGETMEFQGHILNQIRYIRDLDTVYSGKLGGWIESESNLSHDGNCCVVEEAKVYGDARVEKDAIVRYFSIVKDNAHITDKATVSSSIVGADTNVVGTSLVRESHLFFYDSISKRKCGIYANSIIEKCLVEARGFIYKSQIKNRNLEGFIAFIMNHDSSRK